MDDVSIQAVPGGPLVVKGVIHLFGEDNQQIQIDGPAVGLCRCGGSASKPFCDGTHAKIGGFAPAESARQAASG
jgi:CDGSH-type Zn-finger protein